MKRWYRRVVVAWRSDGRTRHLHTWRCGLSGVGIAAVLAGCVTGGPRAVEPGQWFDANGVPVSESEVLSRAAEADILLLGEVHDSASVHRKQVAILRELDGPVVLGLEQLDLGEADGSVINAVPSSLSPRERAERGGFDFDGWGWANYAGLFELATSRDWPLWPLNLSRQKAIAVAMAGDEGWREHLTPGEIAAIEQIGPTLTLPNPAQASLVRDLEQTHGGQMGADAARAMSRAQIARDILMADALVRAMSRYPAHRVVGVMGNQHARRDRGVAYWLDRPELKTTNTVMAVGMLPVDTFEKPSAAAAVYDFIWTTEPVERDDIRCDSRPDPSTKRDDQGGP